VIPLNVGFSIGKNGGDSESRDCNHQLYEFINCHQVPISAWS